MNKKLLKAAGYVLGSTALIAGGLVVGMHGHTNPLTRLAAGAEVEEIRRMLAQDRQDQAERLALLERRLDEMHARVIPNPELVAKARAERARHREIMADPTQRAATQRRLLEQLQAEFDSETTDPYWAAKTTSFIGDAMTLSRETSGVSPRNSQVECRSSRCRISFEVDATAEGEDFMMPLITNLTETLAKTKSVEVISADGKHLEMHVFAEQWSPGSGEGEG